ncbi:MlaE family ABC transporter permease [Minwuia thermotolerans]|uniref:ABC transporter permease n=1 Tax=Minwuia thermotolerans TaxID=2056226 RepID=A0A2M9G7F2_9PROT|nr:ABC transporter permease [Minwuia thermotolerans]PJK31634.1 ABC transporter permease [Minwuia thermotolerans]
MTTIADDNSEQKGGGADRAAAPGLEVTEGAARAHGAWSVAHARLLDRQAAAAPADLTVIDVSGVTWLDTSGAYLLVRLADRTGARIDGASEVQRQLIERVAEAHARPVVLPDDGNPVVRLVAALGEGVLAAGARATSIVGFLGATIECAARTALRPGRLRLTATVHHMEQAGVKAFPIVALISFLVGVVLAFQGAAQLERFGAQIFTVNLIGISVLREIGILLTAIVVAGRSGSAFAAQIGSMKVNEEVDAMRALGLDPMEVLVLPRVLALCLMMGPLALLADISGLIGGGLMAWIALDIPPAMFAERLVAAVKLSTLLVGLVKAPVFGALIAMVGCYEGLRTAGSAESLGQQTTRAVVEGIFIVIVVDAMFSVFFNLIGV